MSEHVLPRPNFVHLADVQQRSGLLARWERQRHRQAHWFVECVAEFMGVFFYCYAGVGSQAAYVLGGILGTPLSSLLQVGIAYAMGIVLALVVCAATSGGHFAPAVTICHMIFNKFPPLKALRYITAQILGGFVACLLVYGQYRTLIQEAEAVLKAKGVYEALLFTPEGPAAIFALNVNPGSSLGSVFLNEFFCDFVIGLVIFACLDPTNFLATPAASPWIVGFVYAVVIWGYSPVGLAANTARDVGGRLVGLIFWGMGASGGSYGALAALTNIPATILAGIFYQFIFADSSRVITSGHVEFLAGHMAHAEHSQSGSSLKNDQKSGSSYTEDEKAQVGTTERV